MKKKNKMDDRVETLEMMKQAGDATKEQIKELVKLKNKIKRNSFYWEQELNCFGLQRRKTEKELLLDECLIYDPDGWNRWGGLDGWEKSLNEKITKEEFLNRVMKSTCIVGKNWSGKTW